MINSADHNYNCPLKSVKPSLQLIKKANALYKQLELVSSLLYDIFGDDFELLDEMQENKRQQILSDTAPF